MPLKTNKKPFFISGEYWGTLTELSVIVLVSSFKKQRAQLSIQLLAVHFISDVIDVSESVLSDKEIKTPHPPSEAWPDPEPRAGQRWSFSPLPARTPPVTQQNGNSYPDCRR